MKFLRTLVWVVLPLSLQPAHAEPTPEFEVKAAFLYNFTLFTEWPAIPDNTINLCVIGNNPVGQKLEALSGKTSNSRKLSVRRIFAAEEARHCQLLFMTEAERALGRKILSQFERDPILTVTDDEELFMSGAMIGLFIENRRMVFEVNLAPAQQAQLSLSSKLLRMARKVNP